MLQVKNYPLGFYPTPLHQVNNFSSSIGNYRVYIKRDDQTGLATGGNKTRKLEYLIGDALSRGADTIITAGAQQSNHCRQTAAACAVAGLHCHLLLRGDPPAQTNGNLLLSRMLGATIHFNAADKKGPGLETLSEELTKKGHKPYIVPYGGSNITGAMGYVQAAGELKQQLEREKLSVDYIFFASSSGGMQAGLTLGMELYGLRSELMPVSIDKEDIGETLLEEKIHELLREGKDNLKLQKTFSKQDVPLIRDFNKAGYGVITDKEKEAISTLARLEGIILDPVYTARAFYGMMYYLRNNLIKPGSTVLFWHTGGIPANFSYAGELSNNS